MRRVGFVQVNDPQTKRSFELDVVAEGDARVDGKAVLLAIGEAKGGQTPRTMGDLVRLERIRGLLAGRSDVSRTRLLLFGRSVFAPEVVQAANGRRDVQLNYLERLYEGD